MYYCFCTAKEIVSKTKKQRLEWKKIFANKATDKGLISKIYKQPMQLNIRKTNKKWELIKLKSFWTAKETINKKTTNRMEENICKQSN